MTAIVGIVEKGKVYFGGDSAISNDWGTRTLTTQKVFQVENMLFGFAGSFRLMQLMRYNFEMPEHDKSLTNDEFICGYLPNKIREFCGDAIDYKSEEFNIHFPGIMLIGYRGKMYEMDTSFAVVNFVEKYNSIGSGSTFALGSLFTTDKKKLTPEIRIMEALKAAAKFDEGVEPPFYIKSI